VRKEVAGDEEAGGPLLTPSLVSRSLVRLLMRHVPVVPSELAGAPAPPAYRSSVPVRSCGAGGVPEGALVTSRSLAGGPTAAMFASSFGHIESQRITSFTIDSLREMLTASN
jgi:hypothetical protein